MSSWTSPRSRRSAERQRIDADGDGVVSPAELAAERAAACPRLADVAAADGRRTSGCRSIAVAAGVSEPAGVGGLPTLRLVCGYTADLTAPLTGSERLGFEDRSYAERIGWREIVILGDAMAIAGSGFSTAPVSAAADGLSHRPPRLAARPARGRLHGGAGRRRTSRVRCTGRNAARRFRDRRARERAFPMAGALRRASPHGRRTAAGSGPGGHDGRGRPLRRSRGRSPVASRRISPP